MLSMSLGTIISKSPSKPYYYYVQVISFRQYSDTVLLLLEAFSFGEGNISEVKAEKHQNDQKFIPSIIKERYFE